MDNLFPFQRPIAAIIVEMLYKNPNELNQDMAKEVSRRLGKSIDDKTISDVRNRIGYGFRQLIDRGLL